MQAITSISNIVVSYAAAKALFTELWDSKRIGARSTSEMK
jgi:hypothetical protein